MFGNHDKNNDRIIETAEVVEANIYLFESYGRGDDSRITLPSTGPT